jgi:hypothetical protein
MWKGRTFQLFFIWLIVLELILSWENIQPSRIAKPFSARNIAFVTALLLPTVYVVLSNYLGLNVAIADAARQSGVTWADSMPLSTEYLVFTFLFCLIIFLQFGKKVSWIFRFLSSSSELSAHYTRSTTFILTGNSRLFSCLCPHSHARSHRAKRNGLPNQLNYCGQHAAPNCNRPRQPPKNRHIRHSLAMRRHREPPHLHRRRSAVPETDAHFLESQNRLLRHRHRSHLSHQHSEDSCYLHNWNERRRRANVPLLLRSTILNRMDRSVSPDNPFKPEPMAQNHQQSERQTAPKRSEETHT